MKVNKPRYNIFHLEFETREEMCIALMRFQVHYECPEFKGKIFTVGQYRSWFAMHEMQNEGFSYNETAAVGINLPDHVLTPFRVGLFDPLTPEEENILEVIPASLEKFYVIGTNKIDDADDDNTLPHEVAHAMYYVDADYKKKVDHQINKYSRNELLPIYNYLHSQGYDKSTYQDEVQAYVGADFEYLEKNAVTYPKELKTALRKIMKQYGVIEGDK